MKDIDCGNGIYFTLVPKTWTHLYDCEFQNCFLRSVTIPDDAMVTFGENKVKADRVILGEQVKWWSDII